MKCKWLIDYSMIKDSYHKRLDLVCEELGIDYQITKYIPMFNILDKNAMPFVDSPKFGNNDCVISYGSIEFVSSVPLYQRNFIPSGYIQDINLKCSQYLINLPKEHLLNENYIMMPYKEFVRNKNFVYQFFNTNKLFVRPDSGFKTFAGTCIHIEDFDYEINSLNQLTSISDSTMILISQIKPIYKEYRCVIGNREVIASSLYKIKDEVIMEEGAPKNVLSLANIIAKNEWQPDLVYTCDIALLDNGECKVIELNSFSCAGLYACNLYDVVRKVSKIAVEEHAGNISL